MNKKTCENCVHLRGDVEIWCELYFYLKGEYTKCISFVSNDSLEARLKKIRDKLRFG